MIGWKMRERKFVHIRGGKKSQRSLIPRWIRHWQWQRDQISELILLLCSHKKNIFQKIRDIKFHLICWNYWRRKICAVIGVLLKHCGSTFEVWTTGYSHKLCNTTKKNKKNGGPKKSPRKGHHWSKKYWLIFHQKPKISNDLNRITKNVLLRGAPKTGNRDSFPNSRQIA